MDSTKVEMMAIEKAAMTAAYLAAGSVDKMVATKDASMADSSVVKKDY